MVANNCISEWRYIDISRLCNGGNLKPKSGIDWYTNEMADHSREVSTPFVLPSGA